jgi:hypothetical protein
MRFALYISLLLLLISCNPEKRILKNKEAFNRIGNEWALQNPCVNDTVTNMVSDTITKIDTVETIKYETSAAEYIVTEGPVKIITRTITKQLLIHDTVINNIQDNRKIEALAKQLNESRESKAKFLAKAELLSKQFMIALIVAGLLLVAVIILIIFLLKR